MNDQNMEDDENFFVDLKYDIRDVINWYGSIKMLKYDRIINVVNNNKEL